MKIKFLLLLMAGSLLFTASSAFGAPPARTDSRQDVNMQMAALKSQADEASRPKDEKPSKDGFILMPQYYYSGNDSKTTNLPDGMGGKLKVNSGYSRGGGLIAMATKEINKTLALSFYYQFIGMEYKGGALQPDSIPGLKIQDDLTMTSNSVAIFADVDLKSYGRLNFHVLQAFDEFEGNRRTYMNGVQTNKTSMDNFSDRLTSLIGWYEIDAPLTDTLTLTPFVGWRSMYAHIENPYGADDESSTNAWVHLVSGGAKLNYHKDQLGMGVSAGINYRTSHDDVWGFATRATEPKFAHAGFNTTLDRTVGAFGANVNYVIPSLGVVMASWNGMFSSNTNTQTVSVGLVIPF